MSLSIKIITIPVIVTKFFIFFNKYQYLTIVSDGAVYIIDGRYSARHHLLAMPYFHQQYPPYQNLI
jgi:hypothetical protein